MGWGLYPGDPPCSMPYPGCPTYRPTEQHSLNGIDGIVPALQRGPREGLESHSAGLGAQVSSRSPRRPSHRSRRVGEECEGWHRCLCLQSKGCVWVQVDSEEGVGGSLLLGCSREIWPHSGLDWLLTVSSGPGTTFPGGAWLGRAAAHSLGALQALGTCLPGG